VTGWARAKDQFFRDGGISGKRLFIRLAMLFPSAAAVRRRDRYGISWAAPGTPHEFPRLSTYGAQPGLRNGPIFTWLKDCIRLHDYKHRHIALHTRLTPHFGLRSAVIT